MTNRSALVAKYADVDATRRVLRLERRARLRAVGEFLQDSKPTASRKAKGARRSATVQRALASIARMAGFGARRAFTAFDVRMPAVARKGVS